jgi:hypothetical protein
MAFAQIGPLTNLTEVAATAVGAGVVLLSVAAGGWGLATRRSRAEVEEWALKGGYIGGGFGAAMAVADVLFRYAA